MAESQTGNYRSIYHLPDCDLCYLCAGVLLYRHMIYNDGYRVY